MSRTRVFFLGALFGLALECMAQDWLGLDAYLQMARNDWVTLPWWIWLVPLAVLAFFGLLYERKVRRTTISATEALALALAMYEDGEIPDETEVVDAEEVGQ